MDASAAPIKAPAGAGITAVAVAMARAIESGRPDRLFHDPYAQSFVDVAKAVSDPGEWPSLTAWVDLFYSRGVVRTRFIDDFVCEAAAGGCTQVVLLGAGLDARAFRLPLPDADVFEVDTASAFAFKDQVLADAGARPTARSRTAVDADLREDFAARLAGSTFDPARRTAWVAEGVLPYLTAEQARQVITDVGRLSAPGSRLVFEHSDKAGPDPKAAAAAFTTPGADRISAMVRGGLGPGGRDWVAGQGWTIEITDRGELGPRYGRPDGRLSGGQFITATRD
ncbi:SAM-dependent methyltransferase [Actinacidiphila paucisporea]|uniref:S-adenosyl-L-methionine-dependent methyltransferase n=1 Tax=Actinacidiphila paucisporea TaxID=310782 RepID=A0A1M7NXA8_9ACTN|nr:SAM-dependent methyltransferase [Actinacidiphila paucisporea]SHN08267.1 methyltransferase, TIGR00027 family [Actinacidiphila paucisporea]